jgi:hypothetical protein
MLKALSTAAALVALLGGCAAPRPVAPRPPLHPERPPEIVLRFTDRMGSSFRLVKVLFSLDGQLVFERTCADVDDACRESVRTPVVLYAARIPEGPHELAAHLTYRGHGAGVFSYLRAYRFEVRSRHEAPAALGRRTVVDATAHERGGVTTPLEQRPALAWDGRWIDL